jgi:hypothetical protein
LELDPSPERTISMAENLIKTGNYQDGRNYAVHYLTNIKDMRYDPLCRFLVLTSYILENNLVNADKELRKLLDRIREIKEDISLKNLWGFGGLIMVIDRSNILLQTKFLLYTLIDVLQGKVKKHNLSII